MSLFQQGSFTLHSGSHSDWKIECDNIDNEEMEVIAKLIAARVVPFGRVTSVSEDESNPASRLRSAMQKYAEDSYNTLLIVDDVFSTGRTMSEEYTRIQQMQYVVYQGWTIIGAVIFARVEPFDWVTPLFTISPRVREIGM